MVVIMIYRMAAIVIIIIYINIYLINIYLIYVNIYLACRDSTQRKSTCRLKHFELNSTYLVI